MNDDNESVQQLTLYTGFKVPSPHHDVWEIVLHNPLSRQIVLFNANANKFAVSTEVPIGKKFFTFSNLRANFGYCRG